MSSHADVRTATSPDVRPRGGAVLWSSRPSPRSLVVAAVAVFAALCVVGKLQTNRPFVYDAGLYWGLADLFKNADGHFSLIAWGSPIRGYAFPLLLHGLREGANVGGVDSAFPVVKAFNAFVFAVTGMLLIPALARAAFPTRGWSIAARVGLTALLTVLWSGYLIYPLSDFPALAAALCALLLATRAPRPWAAALSGAACAVAIEMRPAYLILGPALVVLLALDWRRRRAAVRGRVWAVATVALVAGFAIVVLPQSLSAHRHFGTWSFVPGAPMHLSEIQLTGGTRLQRYETLAGPTRAGGLQYFHPAGRRLVDREPKRQIRSTGRYVGLVITHPLTFADLYVRHAFNGVDQRYVTPYPLVQATGSRGLVLRVLGLALAFLALLRLFWPAARRELGVARWRYPIALAVTVLTSIPGAMETRFLLPLWVLALVLVLGAPWPGVSVTGRSLTAPAPRTLAAIAVSAVAFAAVAYVVAHGSSAHLVAPDRVVR